VDSTCPAGAQFRYCGANVGKGETRHVLKVEEYSAIEALRDECRVEIRTLRPNDRADLISAVGRTSDRSLYRRFFGLKRSFTDQEAAYFMNVDFVNHVALVALTNEDGRAVIAGGGRYIVVQPGQAEVAFVVVDEYQGRGIGRALMRHLTNIARAAELRTFVAEVLPENTSMLQLFKRSGLPLSIRREDQVVHVTISLS
jgi:ribosomal protein S18 acetylase RimI-like enzyme